MMGLGFSEMVIIAGLALVLLGPEKFPDFAKIALRTVRDLRSYMDDVKQEISKEIKPIQNEIKSLSRYDPETYLDAMSSSSETKEYSSPAAEPVTGSSSPEVASEPSRDEIGADASTMHLQAEGEIPDAARSVERTSEGLVPDSTDPTEPLVPPVERLDG